ncbi:hypothetical protein K4K60_008991 [Colletotrichum sp. SAR11_57]|nr:hypothetical protein K4K60_008991 [Colletotrichum sp. SAR11_57]
MAIIEASSSEELVVEKSKLAVRETDESAVLARYGVERQTDGLINWKRDCKTHPRNWPLSRKAFDTVIIIFFEFYTPWRLLKLGQSMDSVAKHHWLASPSFYVGRFIAGLASAVPSVVIAGSVEDMFNTKRRVWIIVLWNAGAVIGLCMGPVYAAYISDALGWRWIFNSAAIVTGVLSVALLGIKESRPSLLLGRIIRDIRKETEVQELSWHNPDEAPDWRALVQISVVRPARILLTEPLVIMVALISASSWSMIYLFTEALTIVYVSLGFTRTQASLPFLAIAVGVLFTFLPRLWDMKVVRDCQRKQVPVQPEDKIMGFAFAAPAQAIGLAWFAWTIPPLVGGVHWIVPTMSLVLVGFAANETSHTLSGYLADSYLLYSASAFSGLALVRAVASGLMPLVAHEMYGALNANYAGTVLAGLAAVFCITPWIFFRFSKRLRQRSPFARFSLETHYRTNVEAN